MVKCRPKTLEHEAHRVTVEDMEKIAQWCRGSIKGTKLPPEHRIIEIFCSYVQSELCAEVGDWIVSYGSQGFSVISNEAFNDIYERI